MTALLALENLPVAFRARAGNIAALDRISFSVAAGETVALIGGSGSGKSVTAYALLGLLDAAGRVTAGRAMFGGADLLKASAKCLADIRGRRVAMVFQNPRAALNPIRTIGRQIGDVLRRPARLGARAAAAEAMEMLRQVGIPDPVRRATAGMFELSGGMFQRVMIAIAVAADPALLIADEPTTGLNVTTQAVVMDIVSRMYHGDALTAELLLHPRHPYARGLVAAAPRLDGVRSETRLSGDPRSPIDPDPNVCRFHGRCPIGTDLCATEMPPLRLFPDHREAACHYAEPPDGLHP